MNGRRNIARPVGMAVAVALSFIWGAGVGAAQWFPYEQIRIVKNWLEDDDGQAQRPLWVNADAFVVAEADRLGTAPADIIMLGDSITAGGRWHEWLPGNRILNRGIGGDTVSGVRRRIPEILSHHPRVVFVMVGINDILGGNRIEELPPIYEDALRALKRDVPHVVLQSVLACGARCDEVQRAKVTALNLQLVEIAKRTGVAFLDLNSRIPGGATAPKYSWDGVHLTAEGYRVWRDAIRDELDALDVRR